MSNEAVYDFSDIARRMKNLPTEKTEEHPETERQPHCAAIDPERCDYPDCPCGVP